MSQAKVDRYKEEKKNRQQIMAKQKREWMLTKIFGGVLTALIVFWAGFSAVQAIRGTDETQQNQTTVETESFTVNTDALESYINSLSEQ